MLIRSVRRALAPQNLATTVIIGLTVVGVAAAAIGSSQVTNNSLTGVDIKNNSIGTADITNNGLVSADVKNGGLLGVDLKDDSVTGKQIDESTLAKVPSATASDTAANADKLGGKAASDYLSSKVMFRYSFGMMKGEPAKTIGTFGPLTMTATCTDNAGNEVAEITAVTSANNLFFDAEAVDTDFDVADGAIRMVKLDSNTADDYRMEYPRITDPAGGFDTFDDGYHFGVWVNHVGKDCWFSGNLINNAA